MTAKSDFNLSQLLDDTVARYPDKAAVIDLANGETHSYAALDEAIAARAGQLRQAGVAPGMCVGLHCPSGYQYIVWAYAIWKCAAVIVPIAVELSRSEKVAIAVDIELDGVVSRETADHDIFDPVRSGPAGPLAPGYLFIPLKTSTEHPAGFRDINAAFIRFTSGTTASSKGVVLSHETVWERITATNDVLRIDDRDRVIWLLSMSYHFTVSVVAYMSYGATVILCRSHFGDSIVEAATEQKATFIYGSPSHYQAMAQLDIDVPLPDLRLTISTATSLRPSVAQAFEKRFHLPLGQAYGIIEVGLPCINQGDRPEKIGSVGKPLPTFAVNLRDVGLGDDLRLIEFRGPGMLDAYYKPWRTRAEATRDGWFVTGDLGTIDDDGLLYIRGRSTEVISVGGMKCFPQEVEAVLESYPDVREAWVYGTEDPRLGEIPHADVVLAAGTARDSLESDIRKHCLKELSAFKIPQKINFVEKIPLTASGKRIRSRTKST